MFHFLISNVKGTNKTSYKLGCSYFCVGWEDTCQEFDKLSIWDVYIEFHDSGHIQHEQCCSALAIVMGNVVGRCFSNHNCSLRSCLVGNCGVSLEIWSFSCLQVFQIYSVFYSLVFGATIAGFISFIVICIRCYIWRSGLFFCRFSFIHLKIFVQL